MEELEVMAQKASTKEPLRSAADEEEEAEEDEELGLKEDEEVDMMEFNWRKVCRKVVVGLLVLLVLSVTAEKFFKPEVDRVCLLAWNKLGFEGLFLSVLVLDGIPQPFTYGPLIIVATKGSRQPGYVFLVCALASYLAALMGYAIGWRTRTATCFQCMFRRYPFMAKFMQKHGAKGIALAALLPLPLAVATWTAGSARVYFPAFLLAATCRAPKVLLFLLIGISRV
mmetsp:Transcript_4749/g.10446  ORF Transcript_4749/g.10446 Transcript_4749/m.10446 type:complete len:226 (+) Transcript_4749:46-723(+)